MKKVFLWVLMVMLFVLTMVPIVAFASDGTSVTLTVPLPVWAWVLITIGIIAFVIILVYLLLPKILALAQRKGWNVDGFLAKAGVIIQKADTAVESLMKLGLPFNIVDIVLDYAATGVEYAEQLWHAGKLSGDERNTAAKDAIYALLKKAGVPEETINSDEIKNLIEIGVEAAVGKLGHALPMVMGTSVINNNG
jgi:hypothetical protein